MNGDLTTLQPSNLFGVDIDAENVISRVGQTGTRDQPDVTSTEYRDPHKSPILSLRNRQDYYRITMKRGD